ncbi:hypothetical protein MHK_004576 [Candidatus Magnetomorum sp. HK-1]|nr:hypothetical protein MHK_004576 [Candidatus Magnetomorum sp. HK-1]
MIHNAPPYSFVEIIRKNCVFDANKATNGTNGVGPSKSWQDSDFIC